MVHAEVERELPNRRNAPAGRQLARDEQGAQLSGDLQIGGHRGGKIDAEDGEVGHENYCLMSMYNSQ